MQNHYFPKNHKTFISRKTRHYISAMVLVLIQFNVSAQISPSSMVQKMNRGINLGNVLSAPVEGNWQDPVEDSYFEDIAAVGFKTVRIPTDFFGVRTTGNTSSYSKLENTKNSYTGTPSDYVVSSEYLDRVEEVLSWSLEQDLVTILDFHGNDLKKEFLETYSLKDKYAAFYTHPTSAKRAADYEKFKSIWSQIATRFKDYPYELVFEIINEPYFYLSASEMNQLNEDIIQIIRNSGGNNVNRNIIITGGGENSFNAPLQISDDILESDTYLIPTFHYYLPRNFTASSGENHNDFDWGTSADKASIDADFGVVKTWAIEKSVSILLGEFGADNTEGYNYSNETYSEFGGPENESRVAFHKYLAQKAIDLGYAFTVWDAGDKSNKAVYLVNQKPNWVVDVRNALLGVECLDTDIIYNSDIECGVEVNWSLFVKNATAEISESSQENTFSAAKAIEINVSQAGATLNTVILKNHAVGSSEYSEKRIKLQTYAKATSSSTTQNFKFRLKITDSNDLVSFASSDRLDLGSNYQLYEYDYLLPSNIKSVEFQVLLGKVPGTYFFDDFKSDINASPVLSVIESQRKESIKLYPNPFSDIVKSNLQFSKIEIYDGLGKLKLLKMNSEFIDTSNLKSGIYLTRAFYTNGNTIIQNLLKR